MDVAFVNRMLGLTRGGGEIWDLEIARALRDHGIEVTFYVGKPLRGELIDDIEGFEHVEVEIPHLRDIAYGAPRGVGGLIEELDGWLFRRRTTARLVDADHDLIHINSDPRFAPFARRHNRPVTIKMNGPPHSFLRDTVWPFSDSYDLFEAFDSVIATGVTTERIEAETDCEVETINPGVDTNTFTQKGEATDYSQPTILYVGRFVPIKNLTFLLDGFKRLQTGIPNSQLVLVGGGPLESKLQRYTESLAIDDCVQMPGYIDNADLPPYYRGADAFALSSTFDNHPITVLEAMSCGTPPVTPTVGWLPEMIDDGETGFLYEPGDVDALATHLRTLLTDQQTGERIGTAARKQVRTEYAWDARAANLATLLHSVITDHSK